MRRRHANELLVLTYHSVVDGVEAPRRRHPLVYRNAVTAEHFEQQMRHLRRHYQILDASAFRAILDGALLPDRAAVVTFDDGLLNNITVALPILRRLQIPAFFFLATGFVGAASAGTLRRHWTEDLIARLSLAAKDGVFDVAAIEACLPSLRHELTGRTASTAILRIIGHLKTLPHQQRTDRLAALKEPLRPPAPEAFPADSAGHSILASMTWDQAQEAARHAVTLGGHTVNHPVLSQLPDEASAAEIEESLDAIATRTGRPADWFAYPYGGPQDVTAFHREVLRETGCCGAFTQVPGFNDAATHPLALHRIDVSSDYDLSTFCYFISGTKHWVDRVVRRRTSSFVQPSQ